MSFFNLERDIKIGSVPSVYPQILHPCLTHYKPKPIMAEIYEENNLLTTPRNNIPKSLS